MKRVRAWLPTIAGVGFWIVAPFVCVCVVIGGAFTVGAHINNVPAGIQGDFIVTQRSCQGKLCGAVRGTFISDDHNVLDTDKLGPWRWHTGETHRVVYNVDAIDVIPLPASWDPTANVVGMSGAAVFLGIWSWCLYLALRRRSN